MAPYAKCKCKCSSRGSRYGLKRTLKTLKPKTLLLIFVNRLKENRFLRSCGIIRFCLDYVCTRLDEWTKNAACVSKYAKEISADKQREVYTRFMNHPNLHANTQTNRVHNFIYNLENISTARLYASCLWNRHIQTKILFYDQFIKFLQKHLCLTFKYLEWHDLQFIMTILKYKYPNILDDIKIFINRENLINFFIKNVRLNKILALVLVDVIHAWFLNMPILTELAKFTGWKHLSDNEAYLLDLDTLYKILLNVIYKTPQDLNPLQNE